VTGWFARFEILRWILVVDPSDAGLAAVMPYMRSSANSRSHSGLQYKDEPGNFEVKLQRITETSARFTAWEENETISSAAAARAPCWFWTPRHRTPHIGIHTSDGGGCPAKSVCKSNIKRHAPAGDARRRLLIIRPRCPEMLIRYSDDGVQCLQRRATQSVVKVAVPAVNDRRSGC
jgi:hypothetical protein